MRNKTLFYILFLSILGSILVSCSKFDGDQTIPAFLHVNSIDVVKNNALSITQDSGFLTHNISAVWITVNEKSIGVFDLPCNVPVLNEGKCDVSIYPVIKQNGMAATRINYPFYKRLDFSGIEFTPDKTTSMDSVLHTMYTTLAVFKWFEDFESPSHNLDSVISICTNPDSVRSRSSCGVIYMNGKSNITTKSIDSISVTNTDAFYLEMDYLTNIPFRVGLTGKSAQTSQSSTIMAMELHPTNGKWRKIYITLGRILSQMNNPSKVQLVFTGINESNLSTAKIYLDNIKIVSY